MSGLAWLNELMVWLGKWFPRPVLVKSTHVAVVFGRAGRVRELAPGLYWYWPISTEVSLVSTRCRTTEVAAQLCGHEAVSVVIAFGISKALTALQHFDDVFAQLDDRAQAHLTRAYGAAHSNAEISAVMLDGMRQEFETWGVQIVSVDVIQRGWVLPLKNLNDWAQHSKAELA